MLLALGATFAYLAWRSTTLGTGSRLALSIPLLLVEIWAASSLTALALLARRRQRPLAGIDEVTHSPLDVVIGAAGATPDEVEISLIACDALPSERAIVVLDTIRRPEIADLARNHGVFYDLAPTAPVDDPLVLFSDLVSNDRVLWISAGQTPMPDVDSAARMLDDPRVAVVQIGVGARNDDSMVHIDRGRDEHALGRSVLNPALSTRGLAPWDGPGSVVRREPLVAATAQAPPMRGRTRSVESLLVRLHAAGFESRFERRPLVRVAAPDTLDAYLAERSAHVARSLAIVRGVDSPLTGRSIPMRVRLRHLATLTPWFDGIRLVAFAVVLSAVIVSGTIPFSAPVHVMAPAAGIVFLLGTLARRRIAGDTMALGDWIRGAWRTAGADMAGIAAVSMMRRSQAADHVGDAAWQRLGRLRLLTASIVLVELAILARAATLIWDGMLPAFTSAERVLVIAVGLATLVPMLDVVQLVVGRRQRRQAFRIRTAIPIVVDGERATTIDLAANGVGFVTHTAPDAGAPLAIELHLPRIDGSTSQVRAMATVRSVVALDDGRVRVGATLADLTAVDRAALISYCTIEQPFLALHAAEPASAAPEQCPGDFEIATAPLRRRALRALTATAAVLGITTAAAGPAFAAVPSSICVTSSAGGIEGLEIQTYVQGVDATDPGWSAAGITGIDGCLALDTVGGVDTATLEVTLDGRRVIADVDDNGAVVVELVRLVQDPSGPTVDEIDMGSGWQPFESGIELLPGRITVRTVDGEVVKLEIVGGTEVALPSGTVVPLQAAAPVTDEAPADPRPTSTSTPTPTPTPTPTEPEPEPPIASSDQVTQDDPGDGEAPTPTAESGEPGEPGAGEGGQPTISPLEPAEADASTVTDPAVDPESVEDPAP
ncbi:MAG: PilZ domain-containing protein [Acidimicrobiales bacterium]